MDEALERDVLSRSGMQGLRHIPFAYGAEDIVRSTAHRTGTLLAVEESVSLRSRTFGELTAWAGKLGSVVESDKAAVSVLMSSGWTVPALVTFRDVSQAGQSMTSVRVAVLRPKLRRNHPEHKLCQQVVHRVETEFVDPR